MGPFRSSCPFGVSTKRFSTIGYHPDLDAYGTYRKCGGISPSHYKIKDIECPFKKRRRKESWTQKLELEEYSRTYGYKNTALIITKHEEQRRGGPGQYDLSIHKPHHNKYENFSFGTTKRFRNKNANKNPGPGTYGVPHRKLEVKNRPHHQWTDVPPFEWDCFVNRFRERYRSWELPCNLYRIPVDGSVEALLSKVVSKRGPYDMFTGPRDCSTIKGYFAPPKFKGAKIWPRTLPGCMDRLLESNDKSKTGQFFKDERFKALKGPNVPGPNVYDVIPKRKYKHNLHPFNCSVFRVRPTCNAGLRPGPGRYEFKIRKCVINIPPNMAETWVFKSKTQRTIYKSVEYNSF